ncbi:MAG: hypothetical protein AAFZ87_16040, partial [Planctomycetota bacterium]
MDSPAPNPAPDNPEPSPSGAKSTRKESIWEVYYPFNADEDKDAVPVASFPMIIYFWPAMLAFLICGIVQSFGEAGVQSSALGWWATGALAFN